LIIGTSTRLTMKAGKSSALVGVRRGLAQRLGEVDRGLVGVGVRGDAADDLHKLHHRSRVHEVEADELARAIGARSQARDGNRGGVRGQKRGGLQVGSERPEDGLLGLFVLGGGLDREVGRPDGLQLGRRLDPADGGPHRFVGDDPAGDLPDHVLFDLGDALVDPVGADVVQQNIVAAQGADMGDARTHLAGADHAYRLDVNHSDLASKHPSGFRSNSWQLSNTCMARRRKGFAAAQQLSLGGGLLG
jgi:hypothetical protein